MSKTPVAWVLWFLTAALALAESPVVPGTSYFPADAEGSQVHQGRVLMDALNCSACHDITGFEPLANLPAPEFVHSLSQKYTLQDLQAWIADPHKMKPGTRMPDIFNDSDESRIETAALAQFLFSLSAGGEDLLSFGSDENGKELFHSIGCAACHEPNADYAPELSATPADPSAIQGESVPIALAEKWPRSEIAAYLLNPTTPAMPKFKLEAQEAADLAAYLQPERRLQRGLLGSLDSGLVAQGAGLFVSRGCAKCHGNPPGVPARSGSVRRKLTPARAEQGCLEEAPDRAPDFKLSEEQRLAIQAALYEPEVEVDPIAHTLATMNCVACHQRGDQGGPEDARKAYFGVNNEMAISMGDFGNIPPKLDHVGRKITPEWFAGLLDGTAPQVRPYMKARMPVFEHECLDNLQELLAEADALETPVEMDVSGLPKHQRGHFGRDLMGTNGLGCVTCHGLKDVPAMGAPAVDLTWTVDRLQPGYFKELLLNPAELQPGTLMPPLFLQRPKADQEIEQIWTYLKELDQRRLPDGLLKTGDFELKPQEADKPIIFRTFLEEAGMQAIAVGLPSGQNMAFDALEVRWAVKWEGKFLDAMSTWDDRYAKPARPLGEKLKTLPEIMPIAKLESEDDSWPDAVGEAAGYEFKGYKLNAEGLPTFLYSCGDLEVEDTVFEAGGTLHRRLHVSGEGDNWYLRPSEDAEPVKMEFDSKGKYYYDGYFF